MPEPRYVRSEKVLGADVGSGETVLLSLLNDRYYGLNATSRRAWTLLEQPVTATQITEALAREFKVAPEECRRDVDDLLRRMLDAGIVRAAGEAP
jgi:hypothetical protein